MKPEKFPDNWRDGRQVRWRRNCPTVVILLLTLSGPASDAAPAVLQHFLVERDRDVASCRQFYQAWVFNTLLVGICKFNGNAATKIGVASKQVCGTSVDRSVMDEMGSEVVREVQKDMKQMGEKHFCASNKAGYDAISSQR